MKKGQILKAESIKRYPSVTYKAEVIRTTTRGKYAEVFFDGKIYTRCVTDNSITLPTDNGFGHVLIFK